MIRNFKCPFLRNPVKTYINDMCFFKVGFTPHKDGQQLHGMKLRGKKYENNKAYTKSFRKNFR